MTLATALYGVGIKSIQAGTISLLNDGFGNPGPTSGTATISAVTTSKAFVLWNGFTTNENLVNTQIHARLSLTNSTTVTVTRAAASSTSNANLVVGYTVVEFN